MKFYPPLIGGEQRYFEADPPEDRIPCVQSARRMLGAPPIEYVEATPEEFDMMARRLNAPPGDTLRVCGIEVRKVQP